MFVLGAVAFGIFGLIIGSFLNVVTFRHNTGRSLAGRSGCLSCGASLTPAMLIPVVSWVIQQRACRACGSRISIQYPLVELLTAALFIAVGSAQLSFVLTTLALVLVSLLICIVIYDIKHTIIPDQWVYTAAVIAVVMRVVAGTPFSVLDIVDALIGGVVVAAPLALLWLVTKGRGVGLGDAKLGFVSGCLLGAVHGLISVMFAYVIGAGIAVLFLLPLPQYAMLLSRWGILRRSSVGGFTMKSEVPFGPFLVAGIILVWFSLLFGIYDPVLGYFGF